jgi:stage II sporulation protein D
MSRSLLKKMKKVAPIVRSSLFALAAIAPCSLTAAAKGEVANIENCKPFQNEPTIKVLVLQDVEGALVEVKGAYNVYDPRTGKKLDSAFTSSSYYMYPTKDGLKWGEEFPGVYQVVIVPDSPKTTILVHGIEYNGAVYAYQVDGAIGFVNEVPVEEYTRSIVASLVQDQKVDAEAVAALAIACRTDAMYKKAHGKTKYWDIKASQTGYQGASSVCLDKGFFDALKMTAGMTMKNITSLSWFSQSTPTAPVAEIHAKAENGKDARAILSQYFPDNSITLVTSK